MLLFNIKKILFCWCYVAISKHLMLLFNILCRIKSSICIQFQNISCYCLTDNERMKPKEIFAFQNISCYCLTSIYCPFYLFKYISKHLMLLFNHCHASVKINTCLFQNISCYCLTRVAYKGPYRS